jgi:hypothetical protein
MERSERQSGTARWRTSIARTRCVPRVAKPAAVLPLGALERICSRIGTLRVTSFSGGGLASAAAEETVYRAM